MDRNILLILETTIEVDNKAIAIQKSYNMEVVKMANMEKINYILNLNIVNLALKISYVVNSKNNSYKENMEKNFEIDCLFVHYYFVTMLSLNIVLGLNAIFHNCSVLCYTPISHFVFLLDNFVSNY